MGHFAHYEWNDAEADSNLHKHRVSFDYATAVFADPNYETISTVRAEDGEDRSKAIDVIDGRLFTVVFVMRGTTCRLISAQRSNKGEHYAARDDQS